MNIFWAHNNQSEEYEDQTVFSFRIMLAEALMENEILEKEKAVDDNIKKASKQMNKQLVDEHKLVTAPLFAKFVTVQTWACKAVKNTNNMSAAPRVAMYISGHNIVPAVLVSGSAKSALYGMLTVWPWLSEFT